MDVVYCISFIHKYAIVGAIGGRGGTETSATVLTSVNCVGNESTLQECSSMASTSCSSQEIATVICQGTYQS